MPKTMRHLLALLALVLLALAPAGCSDSDDPITPGGGDPVDDTAPLVLGMAPGQRDWDVALDAAVIVFFTEPMDAATADAAITLDGGYTDLTWNAAGTELTVEHDAWAEGATVTLTVGAGLTDEAGNEMPQAFATTFYTTSTLPKLLDILLPGGEDAMIPNSRPVFLFSTQMDLQSVFENTVVTEGIITKAVPEFRIGTVDGQTHAIEIVFLTPLDPLTMYTITIGPDAQTDGGVSLGVPAAATFTTAAGIDETGPQILSMVPTLDAVVPTDLASITVTFTEPIDPERVRPYQVSGILQLFMAREPVWNDTHDELTLYMQHPLPAGVRLFTVFQDWNYYDMAGNGNAEVDSISFTTEGTASLFPIRDDLRLYYNYSIDGPNTMARQMLENISGDTFDRVFSVWDGYDYDQVEDTWRMSMNDGGLQMLGFDGDAGPITLTPGVPFLPLPVQATWSGTTAAADGETSVTMDYTAEIHGPTREMVWLGDDKAYSTSYYLEGCYYVAMAYTMTLAGETSPFEEGEMGIYYAPGLGIFGGETYGMRWEDGVVVEEWESGYDLEFGALDDRYEYLR